MTNSSFTSMAEIKSYSRHLILQLRKLLQNSSLEVMVPVLLPPFLLSVPSRSKTGYSKVSRQKSLFPMPNSPRWGLGGVNVGGVVQQPPASPRGSPPETLGAPSGFGRGAPQRRCRLQKSPHPPSAHTQSPWLSPAPKGELPRLGLESLPSLRPSASHPAGRAPGKAESCPRLSPPQPPSLLFGPRRQVSVYLHVLAAEETKESHLPDNKTPSSTKWQTEGPLGRSPTVRPEAPPPSLRRSS